MALLSRTPWEASAISIILNLTLPPFYRLPGSSPFHALSAANIYIYNLLITMVSTVSNKNQKQAASWSLPFIIQQQRTAVNNEIGIYLFLPSGLLPNQIFLNVHLAASFKLPSSPASSTATALNEFHCRPSTS